MDRILLVEDETEVADMLANFLTKKGFGVDVAYDLESGAAKFEPSYDIVLLDIVLSNNQTSFPLLKKIKEQSPDTLVLMVTAHDDSEKIAEAKRLGADGYFLKPFRMDYLEEFLLSKIESLRRQRNK